MKEEFFIGWADPGPGTRRNFLGLAIAATALGIGAAAAMGRFSMPPGDGHWDSEDVRIFNGVASLDPYPMLRTLDDEGRPRTYLLASQGKCGVASRIRAYADQPARLRGSLLKRGDHAMIALADGPDWMETLHGKVDPRLAIPPDQLLQDVSVTGEILDAKCWYGAMRPGHGKPHKACATLCIRSGLPPALFVHGRDARLHPVLLTSSTGASANALVLPYIGEGVSVSGTLVQRGDLLLLRLAARASIAFL